MITITILKNPAGEYQAVQSTGHAGFARKGEDIVCAAVSALFINTLNAIESLTQDKDAMNEVKNEEEGILYCGFNRKIGRDSVLLLDAMVLGMTQIRNQYSEKYIKLEFKEV